MASAILLTLLGMDMEMAEQARYDQAAYTPRALEGGEDPYADMPDLIPPPEDCLNFNLDQFAREIEKAIELSFQEMAGTLPEAEATTAEQDLNRAVGLSLASARREGLQVDSDEGTEMQIMQKLDDKLTAATPRGPRKAKPPVPAFGGDQKEVTNEVLDQAV